MSLEVNLAFDPSAADLDPEEFREDMLALVANFGNCTADQVDALMLHARKVQWRWKCVENVAHQELDRRGQLHPWSPRETEVRR